MRVAPSNYRANAPDGFGIESTAIEFFDAEAAQGASVVPSEWAFVLREMKTYSGLSFADTAAMVCPYLATLCKTV